MSKDSFREQRISSFNGKKCLGKLAFSKNVILVKAVGLQGLTNKSVHLDKITSVTSVPSNTDDNLYITLQDESIFSVRLNRGAVLLAHTLNDILGQRQPNVKLPGSATYRRAV